MYDKKHGEFATHKLNAEGMAKAGKIRDAFDNLLGELEAMCMDGRSLSITRTKLEEACFFAKKSMATDLRNQEAQ